MTSHIKIKCSESSNECIVPRDRIILTSDETLGLGCFIPGGDYYVPMDEEHYHEISKLLLGG